MKKLMEIVRWCYFDIRNCCNYLYNITRYRWFIVTKYVEKLREFDNTSEALRAKFLATVKFDRSSNYEWKEVLELLATTATSVPENDPNLNWEARAKSHQADMQKLFKDRPDLFEDIVIDPYTGESYKKIPKVYIA